MNPYEMYKRTFLTGAAAAIANYAQACGNPPGTPTPTFSDNFATLSLHDTWQAGDKWGLISPETTQGRGGPNFNESGDQWWVNPFNPNTPNTSAVYVDNGGSLNLGLIVTPTADQAYINAQAGSTLPFCGGLLNSYNAIYQQYGTWSITCSVPAIAGFTFQMDIENVQITGTYPPEINLIISTSATGVQTVVFNVALGSGYDIFTMPTGFNATVSHTYSWSWTATLITFFVDGTQQYQVATPTGENYTTNPMFIFLVTAANYTGNGDPAPSSLPVYANITNVSVYAM